MTTLADYVDDAETDLQNATDERLVELTLSAETDRERDEAFAELVDRYRPKLVTMLRRKYGCSPEDAEDRVQIVFRQIYRHLHQYEPDKAFSTWLYSIASNQGKNDLRSRRRSRLRTLTSCEEFTQEAGDQVEESRGLLERTSPDDVKRPSNRTLAPILNPAEDHRRRALEEDLSDALDEMAAMYAAPIRLRLAGLTYEQVAEETGELVGTTKSRLSRGRDRLEKKLGEKGWKVNEILGG